MTAPGILFLAPEQGPAKRAGLTDLLIEAVDGGASVNFVRLMTRAKAEAWWDDTLASHARGGRLILTAQAQGRLDGTVQLILALQENQAFRADLAKMLVHRSRQRWRAALRPPGLDQVRPGARLMPPAPTPAGARPRRSSTGTL